MTAILIAQHPRVGTGPLPVDWEAATAALVGEIDAYLATLPAAQRQAPPSPLPALPVPQVCRYGSTVQPWYAGLGVPLPRVTWLGRALRRPLQPVPVTVGQHLLLTSRYIAAHGWLQGAMYDARGRVCLLGAQRAVLAHRFGTAATVDAARSAVMRELALMGHQVPSVDVWNDQAGRSQAEVHRVLERAAARTGR
jgi:hypothetical protein